MISTSSLYREVHELTAQHRDFVFRKDCEVAFKRVKSGYQTPEAAGEFIADRMKWILSPEFEQWSEIWCRENVPHVWDGPPTGMPS